MSYGEQGKTKGNLQSGLMGCDCNDCVGTVRVGYNQQQLQKTQNNN